MADLGEILKKIFNKPNESVFRLGGDEFCVLAEGISEDDIKYHIHKLHREILTQEKKRNVKFSVAVGYDFVRLAEDKTIEEAFIRADRKMYQNKKQSAVSRQN